VQNRGAVRSDVTVEEFLGMEFAVNKVELFAGSIYELADESITHNRVIGNSIIALSPLARQLGCELFAMSVALKIDPTTAYYPDVFVTGQDDNESDLYCTKPHLIIEVLSVSTAGTDRREKRVAYQRIASMKDYLIVDPETQTVDHLHRENAEMWSWTARTKGDICTQTCLGDLAMSDLLFGLLPSEPEPKF
jgi:Uma2 family endonuclease